MDKGVYAVFNKKKSTFALFEGRVSRNKEFVPYQISPRFKARALDKNVIKGLRKSSLGENIEGRYACHCFILIKKHTFLSILCSDYLLSIFSCETFEH